MYIYVPGMGNPNCRIAIVGEAPSFEEEQAGKPFVGNSGRELDRWLRDVGINRYDCWVTNVSKYMVPPGPKTGKQIPFWVRAATVNLDKQKCIEELFTELHQLTNCNLVIGLGATALNALTNKEGIQDYRGSILNGMGKKTICTFHPAHILRQDGEITGYWQKQVALHDLKRCAEQQFTPDIILPNRLLHICKSSAQFLDFLHRHRDYTNPAIDIEAHPAGTGIPICVGISFRPEEGITIPLWNCDGISSIPSADLVQCWLLLARLLANNDIVGQNFKYDQDKIRRLGFVIRRLASDTMLKAFAINPELPKNLAFNTSIYTEEPFYKNEGMYDGELSDLLIGCARDACVTKEIDLKMDKFVDKLGMRKYYENFILLLHDLYLAIETDGMLVDETRREQLLQKYIAWSEKLAYERFQLAGNKVVNPQSWKQVREFLYEYLNCPTREGTGEEVLTSLFNQVKKEVQKKAIVNILDSRRVEKTIGNYLMALPDFDGRMKSTYYLCLETGRTSTGLLEPPIRPEYRYKGSDGKVKKKSIGTAFQTLTKHGDIGQDIRSMYIADPGYCFINADSSQAEARVIFLLANEDLSLFDKHDLHALTASWFVGGTENDWSKKVLGYEHPNRFLGKTLRHAGHLGARARRAANEVNTQARKYRIDIQIKELEAEVALNIFHKKQPKIKSVFQNGVKDAIDSSRQLRASIPFGVDADNAPVRTFFERAGDELYRQAYSYIPQRSITDNTKASALRIKKIIPDVRILVESHDSLTFLVPVNETKYYVPVIREQMQKPIDFSKCSIPRGLLSIPCDIEIGDNYQEFKKYRDGE
jgi:uracil-DNA glycosylase